jgi:hypothetical protein
MSSHTEQRAATSRVDRRAVELSSWITTTGQSMQKSTGVRTADEPVGIVISRGANPDAAPALLAFVWGPADVEPQDLIAA